MEKMSEQFNISKLVEKKQACYICDQTFFHLVKLKSHLQTHKKHAISFEIDNEEEPKLELNGAPLADETASTTEGKMKNALPICGKEKSISLGNDFSDHCYHSGNGVSSYTESSDQNVCGNRDTGQVAVSVDNVSSEVPREVPAHSELYSGPLFIAESRKDSSNYGNNVVKEEVVCDFKEKIPKAKYVCEVCQDSFYRKSHFKKHTATHADKKPYVCHECHKCFKKQEQLNSHSCQGKLDSETCSLKPNNEPTKRKTKDKSKSKTKHKSTCKECGKTFKSECYLRRHFVTHSGEKAFACTVCSKRFSQIAGRNAHLKTHLDEKEFTCHICCKGFTFYNGLKVHLNNHALQKLFECKVCHSQFSNKYNYKRHCLLHTDSETYTCSLCQKSFAQKGYLKIHFRLCSSKSKKELTSLEVTKKPDVALRPTKSNFATSSSDVATTPSKPGVATRPTKSATSPSIVATRSSDFATRPSKPNAATSPSEPDVATSPSLPDIATYLSNLPNKRRKRYSGKNFICEVCNRQFTNKCYLDRHFLTHSKEKPYVCTVCFKGFSQVGNLNVHYLTHGDKSFICDVCDKAFRSFANLKVHQFIHSTDRPFKCEICGKGFMHCSFLQRHLFSHSDVKPYVCGVCGKGFSQVGNMNVHMLSHTREKKKTVYHCDVCNRCFTQERYFKRHYDYHLSENAYFSELEKKKLKEDETST